MNVFLRLWCVLAALMMAAAPAFSDDRLILDELDSFWAEVSRTVIEGDFQAYAKTYHEDAIVVSGLSKTSQPVSRSLAEWEEGFIQTSAGKNKVGLEFRFTQRINDASTAHETGLFRYSSTAEDGTTKVSYIRFEALLIKKNGWKTLMEYQKTLATPEEWDAAATNP
jgi:ketosteroid isomerase-like protein